MSWYEENKPKGFVELRPHQKEAVEKLRSGNILCGGTGSGKSITALAFYYTKICEGIIWKDGWLGPLYKPKPLYIITTARKRDTHEWEEELDRFDICSDVSVVIDSWNNVSKYKRVEGAFFIFDEQRACGKGKWAKSFERIAKFNQWIMLSATPGDKWEDYIPVFLANGFYRTRSEFMNCHAIYDPYVTKFPKIKDFRDKGHLEFLRRKITVVMPYDKKTYPHYIDITVPYDEEKYQIVLKKRLNPWTNEPVQDIAGACFLMRRAANSGKRSFLLDADNAITMDARSYELIKIGSMGHKKLIIFYNWDYELEAMREAFDLAKQLKLFGEDSDFVYAEWNGHKHEPIPETKCWFYIVQYNAGAEGWNCIKTDALAYYSLSYSYKAMTQAAGRIDRLNTPFEDLYYYVLKSEAPIDKAIVRALDNKRDFNEAMFWDKQK